MSHRLLEEKTGVMIAEVRLCYPGGTDCLPYKGSRSPIYT